jgi:hypothetical protein
MSTPSSMCAKSPVATTVTLPCLKNCIVSLTVSMILSKGLLESGTLKEASAISIVPPIEQFLHETIIPWGLFLSIFHPVGTVYTGTDCLTVFQLPAELEEER